MLWIAFTAVSWVVAVDLVVDKEGVEEEEEEE